MKIVIAVKCVGVLDDEVDLAADASVVDPEDLEFSINEWDEVALEAGLQMREAIGDGEILVVTVGGEEAEETLRGCLARGADRALRIWDGALVGADPLATAYVLAATIRAEAPDLVLCGVQSSDGVNGATGAATAGLLGLRRVAVVRSLEYDGEVVTVERELEGGVVEVLRVRPPTLLTLQTGRYRPRYANLRAIKLARDKQLKVLGLSEIGLDIASVTAAAGSRSLGLRAPDRGKRAEMLDGTSSAVAARVAEIVRERLAA